MLHTLMHSPFQCDYTLMVSMVAEGDDLLLLQDGVLAALRGNRFLPGLLTLPAGLYVLQADVEARGLTKQIADNFALVSYTEFVSLTEKHPQQMIW